MKPLALVILAIFLMAACATVPPNENSLSQISSSAEQAKKKPRIPKSLKASILDAKVDKIIRNNNMHEMQALLGEIDKELERPNISIEDIRRGWYEGSQAERKYGTPSAWIWINDGTESRWVSPNILDESSQAEDKELCRQSAGIYITSCIDSEKIDCEYVPNSYCNCMEGTSWHEKQGCLLIEANEEAEGEFIIISSEELRQGWYKGLPSEKKLNTPDNWIWQEAGQNSRWQNPGPTN